MPTSGRRSRQLTDVYRYSLSPDAFPNGLHRRQLPTLAVSEGRPLRDKSGPASVIQSLPADDFTYCVALIAGECRPEGRAGSIYIKVPGLDPTKRYCFAAETSQLGSKDVCIGDTAMHGPGVPQYWPQKGMVDTKKRYVRVLTRLFLPSRWTPSTSNPKILPDASWLIYGGVTWASAPLQTITAHPGRSRAWRWLRLSIHRTPSSSRRQRHIGVCPVQRDAQL